MRHFLFIALLICSLALTWTGCKENDIVTPPTFTDSRDGEVYNTVEVGDQVWMAENMRFNDSTSVANTGDVNYGRLYTYDEALVACPSGWHLPSDVEWKTFEIALGMSTMDTDATGFRGTDQGTQLKSTIGWNNNGNGTNSSGFNGFPSSYYSSGVAEGLGDYGYYWTSSVYTNNIFAWSRRLTSTESTVGRDLNYKTKGLSCRCIQD